MASAWGGHLQQVVGMPNSLSCGSGGGQKLRAVGGGSIHKLPRALPGRHVVLSLLGFSTSATGTVAPGTYSTCSGCRWLAWFPRGGARGSGCLCVLPAVMLVCRLRDGRVTILFVGMVVDGRVAPRCRQPVGRRSRFNPCTPSWFGVGRLACGLFAVKWRLQLRCGWCAVFLAASWSAWFAWVPSRCFLWS